jgi:hypothetical protein
MSFKNLPFSFLSKLVRQMQGTIEVLLATRPSPLGSVFVLGRINLQCLVEATSAGHFTQLLVVQR